MSLNPPAWRADAQAKIKHLTSHRELSQNTRREIAKLLQEADDFIDGQEAMDDDGMLALRSLHIAVQHWLRVREEIQEILRRKTKEGQDKLDQWFMSDDFLVWEEKRDASLQTLRGAIEALDEPKPNGRPRGSGNPDGVVEGIRALMPTKARWTGAELRDALRERGTVVPGNQVSSTLNAMRSRGEIHRVQRGVWEGRKDLTPPKIGSTMRS